MPRLGVLVTEAELRPLPDELIEKVKAMLGVCVNFVCGQARAEADTQVRPYTCSIISLIVAHLCAPSPGLVQKCNVHSRS